MNSSGSPATIPLGISPSELPALSTHRLEVLKTANDPNVTVGQMEEVIGRDQSLALRVLKIANSPLYGRSGDVKSIRRAVFLLGRDQIKHAAAALAIAPIFDMNVEGLVNGTVLWKHALATASWVARISKYAGRRLPEHMYTASLMHDIGLVIMLKCVDQEISIIQTARDESRAVEEVEREQLGTDHGALAAAVCDAWGLPPALGELLAAHHEPADEVGQLLALGQWMARHTGFPEFDWMSVMACASHDQLDALELKDEDVENILMDVEFVRDEVAVLGSN